MPDALEMPDPTVMSDPIEIAPLADYPQFVEACSLWDHSEWGSRTGHSLNEARRLFQSAACEHDLPVTRVAIDGDRLVGMASLILQEGASRAERSPWLASVFVDPDYRRRGIAGLLIEAVIREARTRGRQRLSLFTPDQQTLYRRHGFEGVRTVHYNGLLYTVMALAPGARGAP